MQQSFLEIHVVPNNVPGFVYPQAGKREEPEQVRTVFRLTCP